MVFARLGAGGARLGLSRGLCLAAIAVLAQGCPFGPDAGLGILVHPGSLDYGADAVELTLEVRKSRTANAMGPLVITASDPWITPLSCMALEDDCVSRGRNDALRVPIRINRALLAFGENTGELLLNAGGAGVVRVTVSADGRVAADFEADNRRPLPGQNVRFTNRSQASPEFGDFVSFAWDFGDGNTSMDEHPVHAYAAPGVYTVSLTAATASKEAVRTRTAYITAPAPRLRADFTASPQVLFEGRTVQFTDTSTIEEGEITEWRWDFGDGNTSTERNPAHVYASAGLYTVSLRVRGPFAEDTRVRERLITVQPAIKPQAAFTFTPQEGIARQPVRFIDQSDPGTAPIDTYFWSFGDNTTSASANPVHIYDDPGTYRVILTVTTELGVSTATRFVTVTVRPPAPDFTASPRTGTPETLFQFTDATDPGSAQIEAWRWDFGDGNLSFQRNPAHRYAAPGVYTVSLQVTTSTGATFSVTKEDFITVDVEQALRNYVETPDPNYDWRVVNTFNGFGFRMTVVDMTSLAWRSPQEVVQGRVWRHFLTIIEPTLRTSNTALLFVSGGNFGSPQPTLQSIGEFFPQFAVATGSVVALVNNIPGQPMVFADEEGIRSRTEDALIAYSYDRYLEGFVAGNPDPTWAALFPMTKAAVRALDTVQAAMLQYSQRPAGQRAVNDFVVSGASKRGWTMWLTGAVDDRVRAVMPIVIDVLNMDEQMIHHRSAYGFYAPAIYDYVQNRVFDRLGTEEGRALLRQVDPFEYRDRLDMPKLILNSTGDQFFLPDSSQFYLDEMPGENFVNYAPNTDHSLDGSADLFDETSAVNSLLAFYLSELQDIERPRFTWSFEPDGSIVVETETTPQQVLLWQATNPETRDFRLERLGPGYTSSPLAPQGPGRYVASVPTPAQGWTAFFVQLTFNNPAQLALPVQSTPPFVFTTPVRVVPDAYPEFTGERFLVGAATGSPIPALKLYGTAREMGQYYGELMEEELQAFIPEFISRSQGVNSGLTNTALDNAWTTLAPRIDPRIIDELEGIAEGSGVSLVQLRRANMIPVLESIRGNAATVWGPATASGWLYQTMALSGPLDRGLQEYPQITLYIPDDGIPHTTVGFTGLILSTAGVNLGGIATAAIGEANPVPPDDSSHYLPMFREMLYDSLSLRQALAVQDATPLIQDHRFLLGDGRNERRGAKVRVLPPAVDVWFQNDPADEAAPNIRAGLLHVDPSGGLFSALNAQYGLLGGSSLRTITANEAPAANNLQNVVIDTLTLEISAAYASGTTPASGRPYAVFNMQSELP